MILIKIFFINGKSFPIGKLGFLALVPILDRRQITNDAAVNNAFLPLDFDGTHTLLGKLRIMTYEL
jgi:hypothetical protein